MNRTPLGGSNIYFSWKVAERLKRNVPLKIYCILDFPPYHKTTESYSEAFKRYSVNVMTQLIKSYAGKYAQVERVSPYEYTVFFEDKTQESAHFEKFSNFSDDLPEYDTSHLIWHPWKYANFQEQIQGRDLADVLLDFYGKVKSDTMQKRYNFRPQIMEEFPNVIKHCRGAELLAANADEVGDWW